ncbi:hypothetical protein DVH24_000993 [Malus domestica]|uniref:Uncharacterized protein n=1 Tax=Malus domestica TaxID=3750 RepID=A0A498JXY0_MALDO|nr:hypothetical protein DVH24_000993 [Malus domestica]
MGASNNFGGGSGKAFRPLPQNRGSNPHAQPQRTPRRALRPSCVLIPVVNMLLILLVILKIMMYLAFAPMDFAGMICLGSWAEHGERTGGFYACNRYEAAKQEGAARISTILCSNSYDEAERRREMAKNSLEKYTHYYERWASNQQVFTILFFKFPLVLVLYHEFMQEIFIVPIFNKFSYVSSLAVYFVSESFFSMIREDPASLDTSLITLWVFISIFTEFVVANSSR